MTEQTFRLTLMRHAKSSWAEPGMGDFDRPLNNRGEQAALTMAAFLFENDLTPTHIVSSSARRTRQTSDLLSHVLPEGIPALFEKSLYLAAPQTIFDTAMKHQHDVGAQSILMIGHNPGIHELALTFGASSVDDNFYLEQIAQKFPTAAVVSAIVKTSARLPLAPGSLTLTHFAIPKDLPK